MKGAGLEKCTPRNRSACCRLAARPLIGRVEVLLPMTASGRAAASMAASTGPLTAGFSETASSTKSASATAASRLSAARRLASTRSVDPGSKSPWSSKARVSWRSRSRWPRVVSASASLMTTWKPAMARTWAIPPPMYPAPTTATFVMLTR